MKIETVKYILKHEVGNSYSCVYMYTNNITNTVIKTCQVCRTLILRKLINTHIRVVPIVKLANTLTANILIFTWYSIGDINTYQQ